MLTQICRLSNSEDTPRDAWWAQRHVVRLTAQCAQVRVRRCQSLSLFHVNRMSLFPQPATTQSTCQKHFEFVISAAIRGSLIKTRQTINTVRQFLAGVVVFFVTAHCRSPGKSHRFTLKAIKCNTFKVNVDTYWCEKRRLLPFFNCFFLCRTQQSSLSG